MTDEEFYADRCWRSDLLKSGCACCRGFANTPTPRDPDADEHPRMDLLGTGNDTATGRCHGCHEEMLVGENVTTDLDGLRTHRECA